MNYKEPAAQAFKEALEAEGFEVQHYHGRGFFEGPSVSLNDRVQFLLAIRAVPTELVDELQWDTLGKNGYVLYGPKGSNPDDSN